MVWCGFSPKSRVDAPHDMVIGQDCLVVEDIDNLLGTGAVVVSGKEWTARMEDASCRAEKGSLVTARRIEGVKLIVENKK